MRTWELARLTPLLCCLTLGSCPTGDGPTGPEADDDDDDDSAPAEDPVSAVIGPEGGELTLPNGTTLVVPVGAVAEAVEFSLATADPEPTGGSGSGHEDGDHARILAPFTVGPAITTLGDPFLLELPASDLPAGATAEDLVLVVSSDGSVDGPAGGGLGRIHPMWGPRSWDADGAAFSAPALVGALFQPMALTGTGDRDHDIAGTMIGHPCSEVMGEWYDAADVPADVDTYIRLRTPIRRDFADHRNALGDPGAQIDLEDAVNRFLARVCMATYRSRAFFIDEMVLPAPEVSPGVPAVRVTVDWEDRAGDGLCEGNLGEANGTGITVYFNPDCEGDYPGWRDATTLDAGYNTELAEPDSPMYQADWLEVTMAHELYHYTADWANWTLEDLLDWADELPRGRSWVEGGADAAAELVYDSPLAEHLPAPIWEERAWDIAYPMSAFWRYLDWEADPELSGTVLRHVLEAVRGRADPAALNDPILGGEIDDAIAAMFPDEEDYDRRRAFADFAAAYLYLHDFERDTGDDRYDETPDVFGNEGAEEQDGELWGEWTWDGAVVPNDIDQPGDPEGLEVTPAGLDDLGDPLTTALDGFTARLVELDLAAVADGETALAVLVTALDPAGDPAADLAVRLFARGDDRPDEIAAEDTISAEPLSPTALPIAADRVEDEVILILANVGEETLDVEVSLTSMSDRLYVLGRGDEDGALFAFELEGEAALPVDLGPDQVTSLPLSGAARSLEIGGGLGMQALASGSDGWLAVFVLADGQEFEVDLDEDEPGPDRLDLTPWGSTPRGIAVTSDGLHALVALDGAVVLVDVTEMEVLGALHDEAMGLLIDERPWDIAVMPDDSKAYVSLWGWPTEGERVLVLDLPGMLAQAAAPGFGGEFDAQVVFEDWVDVGGSETNPQVLRLSPGGLWLAVTLTGTDGVAIVDTSTDALWDVAPGDPGTDHFYPPEPFEPSVGPQWVEWAEDSSAVYVGYLSGYLGGRLSGNGTVRKCPLAEGHCDQEVGVTYAVRSLFLTGTGDSRVVWVLDSLGLMTPLSEDKFIPVPGVNAGTDPWGVWDGTGGCVTYDGSNDWIAEPCPEAAEIGMSGSEMGRLFL